MAKAPALSTQLKTANAKIVELEKKLADSDRSQKYLREAQEAKDRQIEEVHTFLDALPGAIERKIQDTYHERSPMTRLAAWFAARNA